MKAVRKLRMTDFFCAAAIFLSVLLLYLPTLRFEADVLDDVYYTQPLTGKDLSRFDVRAYVLEPVLNLPSPLVKVTFLADRVIWGWRNFSAGLHFSNTLFFAVSAVLLYFLSRSLTVRYLRKVPGGEIRQRLRLPPVWAAMAATVWAWHPQRVESVAWISERKDVLLAILFFAALLTFIRAYRRGGTGLAAFFFFLLSFAIKPMLITFPLVVWVWMKTESGKFFTKRNIGMLLPYLLLMIAAGCFYLVKHSTGLFDPEYGTPYFRLRVICWNLGNYFQSALIPTDLIPFRPFYNPRDCSLIPAVIAAGCLLFLAVTAPKYGIIRDNILPVILLFPAMLLPVCGIVRIGNCDWADRYNLLPSVFLLFPVIFLLRGVCVRRKAPASRVFIILGVYALFLAGRTYLYEDSWRSYKAVRLASIIDVKRPNYRILFLHSAAAFIERDFKAAGEMALSISPDSEATPFDRKMIYLYHRSMGGLLGALNRKHRDGACRELTELILGPDASKFNFISSGFLDMMVLTAAPWHAEHGRTDTAVELHRVADKFGQDTSLKRLHRTSAALLRKNIAAAEKELFLLKKSAPGFFALPRLEEQLSELKRQHGMRKL